MNAPTLGQTEGATLMVAGVVALVVVIYVWKKGASLTASAKDADGNPTTAYQNAGPIGVAGAAANAVSGGWLATFGNWLGSKAADLTQTDPNAQANAALADKNAAAADLKAMPIDYGAATDNPYGW